MKNIKLLVFLLIIFIIFPVNASTNHNKNDKGENFLKDFLDGFNFETNKNKILLWLIK